MSRATILLPTYNEAGNIEAITKRIFECAPECRVLVIDDNSPDGTGNIVKNLMRSEARLALLSRPGKEGLRKAYQQGFGEVLKDPSAEFLITMDADFSHDPAYLPAMLKAAETADVVIASRYCRGGGIEGWNRRRRLLSAFANRYCRTITGMPVTDSTAGFMLMRASALRKADFTALRLTGYAFLIELKYRLWKSGARIVEVPIVFKERREGESKISKRIVLEGIVAPWRLRFGKTL